MRFYWCFLRFSAFAGALLKTGAGGLRKNELKAPRGRESPELLVASSYHDWRMCPLRDDWQGRVCLVVGGGSRNREWQLVGMVPGLVPGEFCDIRKVGR